MHPLCKNQFPDMILFEDGKFEYFDCKVYTTKGKVYIGEKLEKPNAIYVMFDETEKRVDFRRGLQFNPNLEHANHIMDNMKMNMPKVSDEQNDVLKGQNGGFGYRIVRRGGKKYVPWKDMSNEQQEKEVLDTITQDITEYLTSMTEIFWGPFEKWMEIKK